MYKIITAQIVPDGGLYLNLYVSLDGSRTPLRDFSGLLIATSASRLSFSEPNIAAHTRILSTVHRRRTGAAYEFIS